MDRFELKAQLDKLNIPYPLDVTTPELEKLVAQMKPVPEPKAEKPA